jgi:hypothetical protein
MPDFVNDSGTSAVLVHGERGRSVFSLISKNCEYREALVSPQFNGGLECKNKPANYDRFWDDYFKFGITRAARRNIYGVKVVAKFYAAEVLRRLGLLEMVKEKLRGIRNSGLSATACGLERTE